MAIKTDTFTGGAGGGGGAVDSVNGDTGVVVVTLDGVTDQNATTTNAVTVGGVTIGTEYTLPTTDGTTGQAITTDGNGTLTFSTVSSAVSSVNTQTGVVVLSGDDIAADHTASNYTAANANIDGHLSGIDTKLGTLTAGLTYKGSYNATTNSPALTNAEQGDLYIVSVAGTQFGQTWAVGDHLLVNADMGGVIDNAKIDKIDNTDQVTSVNTQTGAVVLSGNDIAADHTASNYTAANANVDGHLSGIDSKFGTLGTASTSDTGDFLASTAGLDDLSDVSFTAGAGIDNYVLTYDHATTSWGAEAAPTAAAASETVAGVVELATNAEAAAGTATNKAIVPSNISSLDLSTMDNTTAGFISDITSESLNDLSDVSFTAGAGIDNYVLTYDHATTSWGAEAAASGGLSEVVQDLTPQLGGDLDVNGKSITSASNGDVTINPDGTGDISIGADVIPDTDATHTIGSEDNRYITVHSDLNGAIRFKAKNDQGAQITKGQVVYIKGLAGDGTTPTVALADANDVTKMPAFGLAFNTASQNAEVQVISFGNLGGLDTSGFTVGDTLFVDTTAGALTATKPTGETSQLQNIGRVVRSDNGAGVIKVGGAGRSAATPNLDQDKIFLGNASNQAVSTALSAIALSSFNDDLSYLSNVSEDTTPQLGGDLDVNGQDIVSASNGDIEIAPNGTGSTILKGNATGGSGHIKFNCEQNSHAVTVKAPAHTDISTGGSYTLTLPTTDGDADQVLKTDGSGGLDWVDQPAGASPASETVAGVVELATNAEAAAATATDKAIVPSNVSSLDLSAMDNTTAGFISDITGESLNDLNDVSYTAGAGIDNYVLTYDHATTSWGAEAAASGGYTVSSVGSSDIVHPNYAANNTFYYVNTASGTTTTISLPNRDYSATDQRIKFFNHGDGLLKVQETSGVARIHPNEAGSDGGGSGTSYKIIGSRCVIEFLGIPNTYNWEWAISSQLELGKDTLANDGDVLRYDSSTDQMTALPYTFPTTDGSANQILQTDGSGALTFVNQSSAGWTYSAITADPANAQAGYHYSCTGTFTITLPTSGVSAGSEIRIKNMGTGTITIDPQTQNIDDSATDYTLDIQFSAITLVSTGTHWEII